MLDAVLRPCYAHPMPEDSATRSIRYNRDEWAAIVKAARELPGNIGPSTFVRRESVAAARRAIKRHTKKKARTP